MKALKNMVFESFENVNESNDSFINLFKMDDIKNSAWREKQRKKKEYIQDAMIKVYNLFRDKKIDMKGDGKEMLETIKKTCGGDDGVAIITLFDLISSGYVKSGGVVDQARPMTSKEIEWIDSEMSKEMQVDPSSAMKKMKEITLATVVRKDAPSPRLLK